MTKRAAAIKAQQSIKTIFAPKKPHGVGKKKVARKVKSSGKSSLHVDDWIKMAQPFVLTKSTFESWPIGHVESFLLLDRHHNIWGTIPAKKELKPAEYFRDNKVSVEKTGTFKWRIIDPAKQIENKPQFVTLDVRNLGNGFDWQPVDSKGAIDQSHYLGNMFLAKQNKPKMPWDNFPGSNAIGHLGFMIPWSQVGKMPNLYHTMAPKPKNFFPNLVRDLKKAISK